MKIILNWLLFIAICAGLYFAFRYLNWSRPDLHFSGWFVVLVSLSLAFTWVEKLHWGTVKPFNCVACLTGWYSLVFAWVGHVEHWYFYLFIGLFVGSMWEAVKMRWL